MLLFRSDEGIDEWSTRTGMPRGETLTLAETWALAKLWYGNRMERAFRGRTVAEAEAIFRRLGLVSSFWYMGE